MRLGRDDAPDGVNSVLSGVPLHTSRRNRSLSAAEQTFPNARSGSKATVKVSPENQSLDVSLQQHSRALNGLQWMEGCDTHRSMHSSAFGFADSHAYGNFRVFLYPTRQENPSVDFHTMSVDQ
jgi:hypothetical protein